MAHRGRPDQDELLREMRDMMADLNLRVDNMSAEMQEIFNQPVNIHGENPQQQQDPGSGRFNLNMEQAAGISREIPMARSTGISTQLKWFMKLNPRSFEGRMDPMAAERWIEHMETIFSVMDCTSEQRVQLAVFKLEGRAKQWWSLVGADTERTGIRWDWPHFKEKFLEYYFPQDMRAHQEVKFLALKQGSMSVEEYINEFLDLAKYSVYLQTSRDELWKARRLLEGARPELKERLAIVRITSFEELCSTMREVERRMQQTEEERKSSMFKASSHMGLTGGISKKNSSSSGSGGSGSSLRKMKGSFGKRKPNKGTFHPNPQRGEVSSIRPNVGDESFRCDKCGSRHGVNHPCLICYHCGMPGHMARHCYLLRQDR